MASLFHEESYEETAMSDPAERREISESQAAPNADEQQWLAMGADEALWKEVELSHLRLQSFLRDLADLILREKEKSKALVEANQKLKAYAERLNASIEREKQRTRDLEQAHIEMVQRLMNASAYKDKETGEHIRRISHYSRILALEMGMDEASADLLYAAAPMHDLGKIGVPDSVMYKEGPLDEDEWKLMRQHPEIGARLLEGSSSPLIELSRQVALCHHERWDGTGYPHGLKGEEIPVAARIVAVADSYDAIRSRRPYKESCTHEHACRVILEGDQRTKPQHFDPKVLEAFARVHRKFAETFDEIRDPDVMAWDR